MGKSKKILVIGGDSLVGSQLYQFLVSSGWHVRRTTRRKKPSGENWVYFDFSDPISFKNAKEYDHAFVVAAATNYERCERDPMAKVINVEFIPNAMITMMSYGVFCTYISTNAVFGGNKKWPSEDEEHDPQIPYAIQKSESEFKLRKMASEKALLEYFNTIRLTKILDHKTPPVPGWVKTLGRGEVITPFEDLIFAPMSVQFVAQSIAKVGLTRNKGNFHLSGAENVSYVDFAREFLKIFDFDRELIKAVKSSDVGVTIAFKPKFSGLGMEKTSAVTGVIPQTLDSVVRDIKAGMR